MSAFAGLLALALFVAAPAMAEAAPLDSCVAGLRASAVKAGVSRAVVEKALGTVRFDEKAVRFSRSQPETRTAFWDYMAFLVDPQRIGDGLAMLERHDTTLRAVERAHGVDRHVVAALWGIESDYGRLAGDFFLPHALANVICAGRKPRLFTGELIQALKLVARGDLKLGDLKSSWAGAFGQTQFLPTTYARLAVDFDRDGRRDLVNSVPDALASAANYLNKAGWRTGEPWGYEVRVPRGYRGPSGRKARAALSQWTKRGVTRVDGSRLSGPAAGALLLPAGRSGPAFLVFSNFTALYSYNAAEAYGLAIGHLSDRLKGQGPITAGWPTDDPGLTRAQRTELQRLLIAAGYDIGEADGRIGPVTVRAIRQAEERHGMPPTGRPGMKIFRALGGR